MISRKEIIETIDMVEKEHFDVRTVTMGISLFSCIRESAEKTAELCYDKICRKAENIVSVAEELGEMYGVPIINKRVSITPASLISANFPGKETVLAKALDGAAKTCGIDFLGGYSALVGKSMTGYERSFIDSIPEALACTERLCSSVNVGSSKTGLNMDAIKLLGGTVKEAARLTADKDGLGCAKFVAFCNAVEDNPFMAGAFHGVSEGETVINVGVSGPGVVHAAIKDMEGASIEDLAEKIKKTAFKITRAGQLIAKEAAKRLNAEFGIVDLSLAPTPVMGDSVAHILEEMGLSSVGAHGTTAALAMLNDAVKKGGVMASSMVGGLSDKRRKVGRHHPFQVRGDDGSLQRGNRYGGNPRGHARLRNFGHDCGRGGNRHDKQQDHGGKGDTRARQNGGGQRGIRRTFGQRARYGGFALFVRKIHSPRRQDARPHTQQ